MKKTILALSIVLASALLPSCGDAPQDAQTDAVENTVVDNQPEPEPVPEPQGAADSVEVE